MGPLKEPQGMDCSDFYALSSIASSSEPWKTSLEKLFHTARGHFIFDNLVIYGPGEESIPTEVLYARAVGRGKSAEADVAWGSSIVNRVVQENKEIVELPQDKNQVDRLKLPYILGLPIPIAPSIVGVLVFIRYGGPDYLEDQVEFAQFLSSIVSSILRQKYLNDFAENLETEKSTSKIQFDFVNTISHELRNPLGFIKGYTTTLLRDDTQWDRNVQIDFLQIIERETNNLNELIDNLLDSSRLQSGQMKFNYQIVRLESLLKDEINRALMIDPGRNIELICEPDIPTIQADTRRLAQVFDNLLSNSRKYAPNAMVKISVAHDPDFITIKFIDNGPGIPSAYISKIFTRFFRIPERSLDVHGSGLGLSICKQIIEMHKGEITAESSDAGTTFIIKLPIDGNHQIVPGEVKA
jgi:two-component system sensor histidine kinase KdpD